MEPLLVKRDRLLSLLESMRRVVVAFSGGIDSTVVAKAAFLALGESAVAVTADSPSVPRAEIEEAKQLAERIGIRHRLVATSEFANPDYVKNDGTRCYYCKDELYRQIEGLLPLLGGEIPLAGRASDGSISPSLAPPANMAEPIVICSGANLDDLGDYRPGLIAAAEHRVRHPLREIGFTKADVRALALHWNLPTWDKPASPCLSSRIAPGVEATAERTARIEAAEAYLKKLGYREFRVRLHEGELARIEVPIDGLAMLADPAACADLVRYLKSLGFRYVTLDMEGFRSGSLNELIPLEVRIQNQLDHRGDAP
ncbi:MAG: 7-cyano-7-deazaguanine synthase [Planctomycetes bacterium]|nr:7-cyano-7-deazaguanine synthase [Planctomycetota bacterium]